MRTRHSAGKRDRGKGKGNRSVSLLVRGGSPFRVLERLGGGSKRELNERRKLLRECENET
jgi:hypothetical protein